MCFSVTGTLAPLGRLMRGESLDAVSRGRSFPVHRPAAGRDKVLIGAA